MRIAGVQTGKNRGDPIELTPEEKVPEAVVLGAVTSEQFAGFSVTIEDIKVHNLKHQVNGNKLRGMWANSRYQATGTARLWLRDLGKDIVHESRPFEWEIEFIDKLDEYQMPDLQVEAFVAKDPRLN